MTYDEMYADANGSVHTLYTYSEAGEILGIGTVDDIMNTVEELSLSTEFMRFERVEG